MRSYRYVFFILSLVMAVSGLRVFAAEPSLKYVVRDAHVSNGKPPLLILMHGIGSNEQDLFSFAEQLPGKYLVVSARGPYTLSASSYAWYHADYSRSPAIINAAEAEQSRKEIMAFIIQLKGKYRFDDTKVYLCGFSQGAIMSYSVGLTNPDKIKGIAPLSGRILDEVKPRIAPIDQLKKLNVFITHGSNDKVIPVQHARNAHDYLRKLGIHAIYKEYAAEHTINREMLADLISWLNKQ